MGDVLVSRAIPDTQLARIRAAAHRVSVWELDEAMPRRDLVSRVVTADGLLCMLTDRIDAELLDTAHRLRVISQMAVGLDNVDLEECSRRGIPVGHTPGVLTETTADTAIGLLLASARRLPEGQEHVQRGRWEEWRPDLLLGTDLHHTTVGIVGLGRIGQAVARRCAGFECRLLYTGRHRLPGVEAELHVAYRPLSVLLGESDHVVLTASLNDGTRHLINDATLGMMRRQATLVNVARGGLVDHEALLRALVGGRIARAALDVTEPEPIPADHPLLGLPNCLIIPHLGSASVATRYAMAEMAVTNLVEALAGRPMVACANPAPAAQAGTA